MKLTKKTVYGLISLVLVVAIVIAAGIGSGWKYNVKEIGSWFNHWGQGTSDDTGKEDYSGLIVTLSADNDILTLSEDSNGELSDSVTVTATVNDVTAKHRNVVFSLDWEGGYNWDNLSDYMTLTVQGNTATATCLQAFGKPIILTATVDNTDVFASYRLDYLKPLLQADNIWFTTAGVDTSNSSLNGLRVDYDREMPNNLIRTAGPNTPNAFGVGTVWGELQVNSIELVMNYMSPTGHENVIKNTNCYDPGLVNTCKYSVGCGVSVRDSVFITDFTVTEYENILAFNINPFDFFAFTNWDGEKAFDSLQHYTSASLLEACSSENSRLIHSIIHFSYVYGDKSWDYTQTVDLSVNFENLTTETTEVNLVDGDGNNQHTFGV